MGTAASALATTTGVDNIAPPVRAHPELVNGHTYRLPHSGSRDSMAESPHDRLGHRDGFTLQANPGDAGPRTAVRPAGEAVEAPSCMTTILAE